MTEVHGDHCHVCGGVIEAGGEDEWANAQRDWSRAAVPLCVLSNGVSTQNIMKRPTQSPGNKKSQFVFCVCAVWLLHMVPFVALLSLTYYGLHHPTHSIETLLCNNVLKRDCKGVHAAVFERRTFRRMSVLMAKATARLRRSA